MPTQSFSSYAYIETRFSLSIDSHSFIFNISLFALEIWHIMTSGGAHLGLHLPTSTPASRDNTAANSPPSPPSTQQPSVARPSSSASALAAHLSLPQNRPSAQPRQSPIVATSNPADKDDAIRCQRDKIAHLQAQIAQLATTQNPAPQVNQPSTNLAQAGIGNVTRGTGTPAQQAAPHHPLFMDEAAAELA